MILRPLARVLPWVLILGILAGVGVSLVAGPGFDPTLLWEVDPRFLLLAAGLGFVPWMTDSLRLLLWARVLAHRLTVRQALRVVIGTELGAAATPTAVGGLPVKVALLAGEGVPSGRGISLSLLKSAEDGAFFAMALPLALLLLGPTRPAHLAEIPGRWADGVRGMGEAGAPVVFFVVAAALVLGLATVRSNAVRGLVEGGWRRVPRLRRMIRDLRRSWSLMLGAPPLLVGASFGATAIQWICRYSAVTALVWALGIPVDPVLFWLLQWLVFTSMTLVPTPGAAGGAEAIFALVYGPLLPAAAVGWLVVGWRGVTFYLQLLAGALVFAGLEATRPGDPVHSPRPSP